MAALQLLRRDGLWRGGLLTGGCGWQPRPEGGDAATRARAMSTTATATAMRARVRVRRSDAVHDRLSS